MNLQEKKDRLDRVTVKGFSENLIYILIPRPTLPYRVSRVTGQ